MSSAPEPAAIVRPAIAGCLEAGRRCRALVEAVKLHDESAGPSAYPAIGPHLRHCLDHFTCFLRGHAGGEIDYDARDRDSRVERDPDYFLEQLDRVTAELKGLAAAGNGELSVRQEAAPRRQGEAVRTSVERELLFLSSHTIHHIAIMSLLAERAGMRVPADLGVAFSTASHEERSTVTSGG